MRILTLITLVLISLSSCDKIEEPFETIPTIIDSNLVWTDSNTFNQPFSGTKMVLIEEFTGHTCQQCPAANLILEAILDQHTDKVISTSIHAGFFAWTENNADGSYSTDFTTGPGDDLHAFYGVTTNPIALVNRKTYNGDLLINSANWNPAVNSLLNQPSDLDLNLFSRYSSDSLKGQLHVQVLYNNQISTNVNVQGFITEDQVIDWQKDGANSVDNYEHNHVFRDAILGTWGQSISATDSTYQFNFEVPSSIVDVKNCKIVVVAYDASNNEVLQANSIKVTF